jgi:NADPH:quinone reductase-like Zn-dependent oxidoreductase
MQKLMQAIVCKKYGLPEVLQLKEVEKTNLKDDEILVKILATAVSSGDIHLRKADLFPVRLFFGFARPKNRSLDMFSLEKLKQSAKMSNSSK